MDRSISAILPAAGSSGRMGREKAILPTGHGKLFAEHLVNGFATFGCRPVVLVVNENFDHTAISLPGLVTVVNHNPGKGRSWSILLGLKQVPGGHASFILNVDNPFLEPALLDKLSAHVSPDSYVVPVYNGRGGHPVLLGDKVVDLFRGMQDLSDFRRELLRFTRIEVSYPDKRILWNINTPEDYDAYIQANRPFVKKL